MAFCITFQRDRFGQTRFTTPGSAGGYLDQEKRELLAAAFTCPQCGQLDPDVWQLGECAQCWAVERGLLNNVGRPSVFNDLAAT